MDTSNTSDHRTKAEIEQDNKFFEDTSKKNETANWKNNKVPKPVEAVKVEKPVVEKYKVVSKVDEKLFNETYDVDSRYPFGDLEVGHAFFVPNEQNQTIVQNMDKVHRAIAVARNFYSEVEVDETGDTVLETVLIKNRKRNPDGTLALTSDGKTVDGAETVTRQKLINSRHFVAYPITKDYDYGEKAASDGVLVVRVD